MNAMEYDDLAHRVCRALDVELQRRLGNKYSSMHYDVCVPVITKALRQHDRGAADRADEILREYLLDDEEFGNLLVEMRAALAPDDDGDTVRVAHVGP